MKFINNCVFVLTKILKQAIADMPEFTEAYGSKRAASELSKGGIGKACNRNAM